MGAWPPQGFRPEGEIPGKHPSGSHVKKRRKVLIVDIPERIKTQNEIAEDVESDIAIRFVDENDYREISAKPVLAKLKLKRNRPSSLV